MDGDVNINKSNINKSVPFSSADGATIEQWTYETFEMMHSVCVEEIGDIAAWLGCVLRSLRV